MNKGKIVQVMGPVVDVVFEDGQLPNIKDALEVENNGKRCVMEVSQHLGNNIVRCIMQSIGSSIVIRLHLKNRNRQLRSWRQVSKLSTFLHHMPKVVRLVCSVVPVLVRQSLSRS